MRPPPAVEAIRALANGSAFDAVAGDDPAAVARRAAATAGLLRALCAAAGARGDSRFAARLRTAADACAADKAGGGWRSLYAPAGD